MQRVKKIILVGTGVLLFALLLVIMFNAYAGKPFISLNSPVSFPVDI